NLSLTIQFPEDNQRYINGMVTRFIQAGRDARFSVYRAELRPWLWALTLTQNCRIFQHLTVPEIIKKIFDDLGFSDYRFRLIYKYDKRDYCVQYQESAFNFVCRLMEDVGIFYFFEHQADKHTLVLADDLGAHPDCPAINIARFLQSSNETEVEDVVTHCQWSQQLVSGQYALKDFNFEIPKVNLKVQVGGPCSDYLIYEYAAGFQKRDPGEFKVRRRIESQELDYQLLDGHSHCFSFTSGYQFTLTEHPRSALNQTYVLRWLSHDLSFTHYQNSFQAFPLETPFRAPVTTPKPRIVGTQTAVVTGPEGEEIWTDRYGRIKVQFHWDQEGQYDENTSCWIRVNQGLSGKGWGHFSLPRIGQEVIVSFFNGDPDRPIVTGAVYNGWQQVPYPLPAEQTKSTLKSNSSKGGEGFNEVRFEDKKGQEQIFIHAEKNQDIRVKNNTHEWIGNERHLVVKKHQLEQVEEDKHLTVKGDRFQLLASDTNLTVKGEQLEHTQGHYHVTVDGDQLTAIQGHEHVSIQGNQNQQIGQKASLKAGSELHAQAGMIVSIEAGAQLTIKAGGSFITLDPSGVSIVGPTIKINSGGAPVPCAPTAPARAEPPDLPAENVFAAATAESGKASTATTPAAAVLKQAAADGTPFCEQCERARQQHS
ncbi:MAG: type VI secretion system tip protein TssI/VgrG, partial [Pseudomonadota bacterium]|nr:type VI secretion system tip protein TssI/VgrG [Pseudomonadota bacterium]